MEVGVIFISSETASIWCNPWKGATKASSLHGDSFISGSGRVTSRILRWCWRWDGAGLNWAFDCSWARIGDPTGLWDSPAAPAAAHGIPPEYCCERLGGGFREFCLHRLWNPGFSGLAGLWLSLVSSILVQDTFPRAVSHCFLSHSCTGTSCLWRTPF